ncbi:MAG: heme ABC exporter ATP-binding protein CcmA [Acidimicrobiia bacterium]
MVISHGGSPEGGKASYTWRPSLGGAVQPVVRLRSAVCLLGRFPALAGVDLDVAPGDVVLFSGGNGAGKTTLLRLIAGLVRLHEGQAEVLGHDLSRDRGSHRRELAFVGHETFCYDDLTVRENLLFAARASGSATSAADAALERVGLERSAGVTHSRLSAGQRRRLALAVALSREPRLLLLDEPHAGLDAEGRAVLDALLTAAAAENRTVLVASHELDRTRALASREVVLTAGQANGTFAAATERSKGARRSDERPEGRRPRYPGRRASATREVNLVQEASLIAGKDLRIERRSRVTAEQILPFGLVVLLLFAFALDPDRGVLRDVAPGLFWVTVLLAALLAVSRSFALEAENGARDGLRLSGLDPAAIFLGKAAAVAVELLALEAVLSVGVIVLFDVALGSVAPIVLTALLATVGVASTGTLYGVLAASSGARETLVPVLLFPVVSPVLLAATRAWEAAIDGVPSEAWPWIGLLAVFAVLYTSIGTLAFGSLLEEA